MGILELPNNSTVKDPTLHSSSSKIKLHAAPTHDPSSIIKFTNVTVSTPDLTRTLVSSLNLSLPPSKNLLIVGNSGSGKSSLLRTVAGLWTSGHGTITRPTNGDCFFLPQKPYCPLGTLREQVRI